MKKGILSLILLCFFSIQTQALPYCSASGESTASEWIQAVNIASIDNLSGNNGGYGDFLNVSTDLEREKTYTISLTPGYQADNFTEHWRIWIDWNHDDDLTDPGELVYDSGQGFAGQITGSFNVPIAALTGTTLMRVSMKWVGRYDDGSEDNNPPNACGEFEFGEVEDYTINVVNAQLGDAYCVSNGEGATEEWIQQVSIGSLNNTSGNNNGYGNYTQVSTILNPGATYDLGLTPGYRTEAFDEYWRVWIDYNQDNDFNDANELVYDAGGGLKNQINTAITIPNNVPNGTTRMRIAMKWVGRYDDGTEDLSPPNACGSFPLGEVEDYSVNIQGIIVTDDYCETGSDDSSYEWIQRVKLGALDNNSGNDGGYGDYSNLATVISRGQQNPIELSAGYNGGDAFTEYWRVWIDFNQDKDFNDPGELVYDPGVGQLATVITDLNIPTNVNLVTTRMRIAMKWVGKFDDGTEDNDPPSSCGKFSLGEVEDYTVTIVEGQDNSQAPISSFEATVTEGPTPLSVIFIDQSLNNPTSWNWTFEGGEPATSTEQYPAVMYETPGLYSVSLTVANSAGSSMTTREGYIKVNFPNNAIQPIADFISSNANGTAPLTVSFVDQSLNSPNSWDWTFAGGTPATSKEQFPTVTYENPGTYSVTLVVSNEAGTNVITKDDYIVVTPPAPIVIAPIANFISNVTSGEAPLVVNFYDQSANNPDQWNWTFEGANQFNSSEQNPTVIYNSPGTYAVELSVSNLGGSDVVKREGYITVGTAPTAQFGASLREGNAPLTVTFFDQSQNNPIIWDWEFPGAEPASSNEKNPTVTYVNPGSFPVTLKASNSFGSDILTEEGFITIGWPVGIEDNTQYTSLLLYPTPAKDWVSLQYSLPNVSNIQLNLFNLIGQSLYQDSFTANSGEHLYRLDIQQLSSGTYFLVVNINGQEETLRLLVE